MSAMGLGNVPKQQLDSTAIDELWKVSPPSSRVPPVGSKGQVFHNDEEDIPENDAYFSDYENSLKSRERHHERSLESYFHASAIRIPEAADVTCSESVVNEEFTADLLPDPGAHITTLYTDVSNGIHQVQRRKVDIPSLSSASLPLIPLHLKFEDIRYKVVSRKLSGTSSMICFGNKTKREKKTAKNVLNGVSGTVAPGEILAMMGPSGSGKTSMLNILGGRVHEKVTGNISYNGLPYSSALKRRIGYVTQDDVLFPILTVRETLVFAALLRLSKTMCRTDKVERAETVLRELGLEGCQNTIVGGAFIRGVSGGERKRTSIGYEILVDPSLLLLDEPTSGLDSSTAFRILQLLRANAQMGRVIVATIHQPSSRMFPIFDKLILLSEGHPIYFGAAKEAMDYFASLQFTPQLPMNPSDFLLDLASGITSDITLPEELNPGDTFVKSLSMREKSTEEKKYAVGKKTESESHGLPEESVATTEPLAGSNTETHTEDYQRQLVMKFLRAQYRSQIESREREKLYSEDELTEDHKAAIKIKKHWNSSWWQQFIVLCNRNCKERKKDYTNILRFAQGIAVAILLGMLWWRPKLETEQEIRDQVGLLFYICIFWCTFSMWSTLMIFPLEKNYLAKERAADMYRLSAYYMSSTVCDSVAELIHPTLFIVLVYFMTGLKSDFITFSLTLLSVYLIAITAQAFGEFFGAATLSVKRVGIVSSMIMLIFLLAGGYYVQVLGPHKLQVGTFLVLQEIEELGGLNWRSYGAASALTVMVLVLQNIPVFLRWIRYLSIVYYGFNLLQRVQYAPEQTYNCHDFGGCLRYDESPIFANMNLDGGWNDAFALLGMAVGYKFLAYLCLRRV